MKPDQLIVALDTPDPQRAIALVQTLMPTGCMFKVGGLLAAVAANSSFRLQTLGIPAGRLMLDLKVWETTDSAHHISLYHVRKLRPRFFTMPVPYNFNALLATYAAAAAECPETTLLGVTVPTSASRHEVGLASNGAFSQPAHAVKYFATLAESIGLKGLVCGVPDLAELKTDGVYEKFKYLVTPGIRPTGSDANDQTRTATPAEALKAGSTHLVIGRPLTQASNPREAVEAILASA